MKFRLKNIVCWVGRRKKKKTTKKKQKRTRNRTMRRARNRPALCSAREAAGEVLAGRGGGGRGEKREEDPGVRGNKTEKKGSGLGLGKKTGN